MNYDIKIVNNYEGEGRIELNRLAFLSSHVKSIAQKALLLQLFGYSKILFPKKLQKYLNIFLTSTSSKENETMLTLDAAYFKDFPVQLELFRDKSYLKDLTPMALVIKTFNAALDEDEDKSLLDEPIIDELLKFRSFFKTDTERIFLSNRNSIPEVKLSGKKINKIENLYKTIPSPQKTVINGIIDEMKFSRKQLVMLTSDKQKIVVIPPSSDFFEKIKDYFGKEIIISGVANFKPGGQLSYVNLESFNPAGVADKFFSRKPDKTPLQQQIAIQIKQGKKSNPIDDIFGKWPGNETDEEFEQMLKELD